MNKRALAVIVLMLIAVVCLFLWSNKQTPWRKPTGDRQAERPTPLSAPVPDSSEPVGKIKEARPVRKTVTPLIAPQIASSNWPGGITLEGGGTNYYWYTRISAIGHKLGDKEIESIYEFLAQPFQGQGNLALAEMASIKNDLLEVLLDQEKLPDDLEGRMLAMFYDKNMDTLWRDFCVQHFALYYEQKWGSALDSGAVAPDKQSILQAYQEALLETDSSIAGTALLGLERLSRKYKEIDRDQVAKQALDIAFKEQADLRSRIASVQVSGLMDKKEILPLVRNLAQSSDSLPLRLASISTIGLVGCQEDMALLQELEAKKDKNLSIAVNSAKQKLKQKENKQ